MDSRLHLPSRVAPSIIDAVEPSLPRLASYRRRLQRALAAIAAGDRQMLAHPIRDSYHTMWFELHEELLRLTGRNRAEEAAGAGLEPSG